MGRGASPADDTHKHIGVFSDVVSHIKSEYVEEPDMKSVTLGALNGLLEAIDPFASYLNAEQYHEYLKNKDVKRADVGLILSKKFGYVGVVGTIPGSPAAKAGFTTGDMIESISGVATRDMPLAYASMLLRGESGTTVELSVVRTRRPEPQTVKLTRANYRDARGGKPHARRPGGLHQYRRGFRRHREAGDGCGAAVDKGRRARS